MGIYIKNMKLPKCCFECPCYHRRRDVGYYDYELCDASGTIFNDSYSSVTGHKDRGNPFEERLANCPLIEVPPHGRLIDADSMEKEVCGGCVHGEHKYENCIDCALANAPIVIPAEEDG